MYIYITRHVYIYHNSLKETVQGSKDDGHVIKTTLKVYYKTEGKSLMNGSLYIHVHHKYILICRSKYRLCLKKKNQQCYRVSFMVLLHFPSFSLKILTILFEIVEDY